MTCSLTTTRRIRLAMSSRSTHPTVDGSGSTAGTAILDIRSPEVTALLGEIDETGDLGFLRTAHTLVRTRIRPVYSMAETRRASDTLRRRRGSCSQRLAVLETVARAHGIPTRTRGLAVDGDFWRPRFGLLTPLLPQRILLAWPQFLVDAAWLDAADLFETTDQQPFTNAGAETLFDAIGRGAAHWSTMSCGCDDIPADAIELGIFPSRDAFFARYGQNLPRCMRCAVEPLFGRWSAGAAVPLLA